MNCYREMYNQKLRTPEEIASYIENDYVCVAPTALGEPTAITDAIAEHVLKNNIHGVLHHQACGVYNSRFFDIDLKDRYSAVSWFTMKPGRKAVQNGYADVMSAYYRDTPELWSKYIKPDVFYATVSPMDKHGYFSFGATASEPLAQLEKARFCFLEVNENMPRVFGSQLIHISQVDALCESNRPLAEASPTIIDDISRVIGGLIAEEIPNGATLQLGVGAIPDAVGNALRNKKDLGIHTELFTESMIDLIECGAVNNLKKNIHKGKSVTAFAYGSRRMYDFIDDNMGLEFHAIDYVNEPLIISQNDNVISINSCLEVDFYGQVCAESIGSKHYSGTGGQSDFVRGANMSKNGKSFIAFPSTTKGGTVSRIVSSLTPGAVVTTSKNDVDYIVTEYGVAKLKGKTLRQRTKALIDISHPKFREQLIHEAQKMNILI